MTISLGFFAYFSEDSTLWSASECWPEPCGTITQRTGFFEHGLLQLGWCHSLRLQSTWSLYDGDRAGISPRFSPGAQFLGFQFWASLGAMGRGYLSTQPGGSLVKAKNVRC